jgi:hypothetical protein
MKSISLLFFTFLVSSCQSLHSNDPSSLAFEIPDGSTLTLNKDLEIPQGFTHALIQAGKARPEKGKNEYEINCSFDMRKFGPRTIKPEVFKITRTEDGHEWFSYLTIMRFYTIVYLESSQGTDVIKLECQQWGDGIDRNFTVAQMAEALGDIFSFSYSQEK